jgi:hypothetical protein
MQNLREQRTRLSPQEPSPRTRFGMKELADIRIQNRGAGFLAPKPTPSPWVVSFSFKALWCACRQLVEDLSSHEERHGFAHLLKGLFVFEPAERWTARQAATHPFLHNQVSLLQLGGGAESVASLRPFRGVSWWWCCTG